MDVTLNIQESFFTTPYLQGKNSTMEDKDIWDFLLDMLLPPMSKPVLLPHSTVSNPGSIHKSMPDPVPAPVLENPQEKTNSSPFENVRFSKVFLRKMLSLNLSMSETLT